MLARARAARTEEDEEEEEGEEGNKGKKKREKRRKKCGTAFYDLAKFIGRPVGWDVPTSTMRFPESTRRGVTHTRVVLSLFERKATESPLALSLALIRFLTLFHAHIRSVCFSHCHRADRAPRFTCKASDTGI